MPGHKRDSFEAQLSECPQLSKKQNSNYRVRWTDELHFFFLRAVEELGGTEKAVPSQILTHMNAQGILGLKRENVASHLQKYRTQLKEGISSSESNTHLTIPLPEKTHSTHSTPPFINHPNLRQQSVSNSPSPVQSPYAESMVFIEPMIHPSNERVDETLGTPAEYFLANRALFPGEMGHAYETIVHGGYPQHQSQHSTHVCNSANANCNCVLCGNDLQK